MISTQQSEQSYSSRFEVGEKLLSSQLVVEISSKEKKSGISEGVGILLIRVTLSSKKVTNVLARSSADVLVGKRFFAFLWRRRSIKVAEHSFRARFRWCNSARAQGFQKTNMPSIERSFYFLNTRTHCIIFLYNWTQCIDGFSLLLQRYVRKERTQQISAFVCYRKTQLNATHAQLLEKLRPIALAETCRFPTIQSLEF